MSVLKTWRRFRPLTFLIAAIWIVFIVDLIFGGALKETFGLIPRRWSGLDGIAGMPFLHGGWSHLAANTPPLIILGALILLVAPERFWRATLVALLIGGVLTWLFARGHNHIGASGLIFAWFGFLVGLGLLERRWRAALGALAAIILCGAPAVIGVLPSDGMVSWDGHLAGLVGGVATARLLRRKRSVSTGQLSGAALHSSSRRS